MKYFLSFGLFFFLVQSCCLPKDSRSCACKDFNAYIQHTWKYDEAAKMAYINESAENYGVKKSLDYLKANMKCWEGMKASKVKKLLPFPANHVDYKSDFFHVQLARECFECYYVDESTCEKALSLYPCDNNILIIKFTAQDVVKEVKMVFEASNKHFGLEVK